VEVNHHQDLDGVGARGSSCLFCLSYSGCRYLDLLRTSSSISGAKAKNLTLRHPMNIIRLADPEHHGVLCDDLGGDQELLQKELDLTRKHSAISLEQFRAIEGKTKFECKLDFLGTAAHKSGSR
jgi:hypothetical protein